MSFHEPSALKVFITVAIGTLARPYYQKYVNRLGLKGHDTKGSLAR
jgi:hypothetical protein